MKSEKIGNRETRNRLLDLIQIVSVKCSLGAQWALPAITSAPAVAGFWALRAIALRPWLDWFGSYRDRGGKDEIGKSRKLGN